MPLAFDRRLVNLLELEHPIILAPMAGVVTPALAAAVSNAGGLGSMGLATSTVDAARQMINAYRAQSNRPFNVNLFCHKPAVANPAVESAWLARLRPEFERFGAEPPSQITEIYKTFLDNDEMLAMLLEEKPKVVSLHFGIPSADKIRALKAAGITLFATATNLREAQAVAAAGVDAVVAQGYEAGGHRGVFDPEAPDQQLGTMALTRLLVRHLDIPVIAAGGIMDGAGIAAVLRLGAAAAQLGTAFIACPESQADDGYRAALRSEAAQHTVLTSAISGRPARSLSNRFTALGATVSPKDIPAYPIAYDAGKALIAAAKAAGETGYGAHWAGQGAPLSRAMPAKELMQELVTELEAA
ncbi:NAD(P)H-dependent flavin oxidoreductase [Rhodoligotrophos ferricapiens]|uniref:NAD(P)H-dependent flavin oxidoreductase n=1 Tax=Rhodoligotrophos ferricapiens TaxID=3069264 RepID=UPI00315DF147